MSRRRLWTVVLALVCGTGLLEVGTRVWVDDPSSADFVFDEFHLDSQLGAKRVIRAGGMQGERGWISINAQGFRGTAPFVRERIEGVQRIAVAGTGHAFGEHLTDEQTWPEHLEQALGLRSGHPVEVYNYGRPGATVVYLDRFLMDEILPHSPDVVILAYGGFNEALLADIEEMQTLDPEARVQNILRGSSVYAHLERFMWRVRREMAGHPRSPKVPVETFTRLLSAAIESATASGAQVVLMQELVIHPDIPGVWELDRMEDYHRAISDLASTHGVPVFDPAQVIPKADREGYFWRDLLYDARSTERIGAGMAELLSESAAQ